MIEYYTVQQAMDRLGLKSKGVFYRLEKRYPDAFVIVNKDTEARPTYHKATLDRFGLMRDYFMKGNYDHHPTKRIAA